MATRAQRFMKTVVRAARRAQRWAGPVLKAAGQAALVAAVATGITAALAERKDRNRPHGRGPKA